MLLAKHPLILVFLAFSLAPAALVGINGPWLGGGERPFLRAPAAFPERLTPETFRRVSTWFNDRLGLRYPLMVLDSHWRLNLWRLRFRGDVLFGIGSSRFFFDRPAARPRSTQRGPARDAAHGGGGHCAARPPDDCRARAVRRLRQGGLHR